MLQKLVEYKTLLASNAPIPFNAWKTLGEALDDVDNNDRPSRQWPKQTERRGAALQPKQPTKRQTKGSSLHSGHRNSPATSTDGRHSIAVLILNKALSVLAASVTARTQASRDPDAQQCLTEKSPNQMPAQTNLGRPEKLVHEPLKDNSAVIDACSSALQYLRACQSPDRTSKADSQIEAAAVSFTGKLLALKQQDAACKELFRLRVSLDRKYGIGSGGVDAESTGDSLGSLLRPKLASAALPEYKRVEMDFHLLVIRAIASYGSLADAENVASTLNLSNTSSLFNACLENALQDLTEKKALMDLRNLSQHLQHLADRVINFSRLEKRAESSDPCLTLFRLRTTLLCARMTWMILAGHRFDFSKEVGDQFASSLNEFTNAYDSNHQNGYTTAEGIVTTFREVHHKISKATNRDHCLSDEFNLRVSIELCLSADAAGLHLEAQDHFQRAIVLHQACPTTEISQAARLRIASICIHAHLPPVDKRIFLEDAIFGMESPLGGSRSDLVEILLEGQRLLRHVKRKSHHKGSKDDGHTDTANESELILKLRLIHAYAKFCSRFMSVKHHAKSEGNTGKLSPEQIRLFAASCQLVVDSTCEFLTGIIPGQYGAHCHDLFMTVAENIECLIRAHRHSGDNAPMPKYATLLMRLANTYWHVWRTHPNACNTTKVFDAMAKIIRNGLAEDQPRLNAPLIFYQLGRALLEEQRHSTARQAFWNTVEAACDCGAVTQAASRACKEPLSEITSGNDCRILLSALKHLFSIDGVSEGDVQQLTELMHTKALVDAEKGFLLECLLKHIVSFSSHAMPSDCKSTVGHVGDTLFKFYEETNFPLRRKRVLLTLMRFNRDNNHSGNEELVKQALGDTEGRPAESLKMDSDLADFAISLDMAILVELSIARHDMRSLEKSSQFAAFTDRILSAKCQTDLSEFIEDVTACEAQMVGLANLAHVEGLAKLRASALLCELVFIQFSAKREGTRLISQLVATARHLISGADSQQAGQLLARAEKLLGNGDKRAIWQSRLHIGYLEYHVSLQAWQNCEERLNMCERLAVEILPSFDVNAPASFLDIEILADTLSAAAKFHNVQNRLDQYIAFSVRGTKLLQYLLKMTAGDQQQRNNQASDQMTKKPKSASFLWPMTMRLFENLVEQASIGRLLENSKMTMNAINHTEKLAGLVKSPWLQAVFLTHQGEYLSMSRDLDKSRTNFDQANNILGKCEFPRDQVQLHCFTGLLERRLKRPLEEARAYEDAQKLITDLINGKSTVSVTSSSSNAKSSPPSSKKDRRAPGTEKTSLRNGKKSNSNQPRKKKALDTTTTVGAKQSVADVNWLMKDLKLDVDRRYAETLIEQGQLLRALPLLHEGERGSDLEIEIRKQYLRAKILLGHAESHLTSNAVGSILQESAMSFPSASLVPSSDSVVDSNSDQDPCVTSLVCTKSKPSVTVLLQSAQRLLTGQHAMLVAACSAQSIRTTFSVYVDASALLAHQSQSISTRRYPVTVAHALETSRSASTLRQQFVCSLEAQRSQSDQFKWPEHANLPTLDYSLLDLNHFQESFIDILPASWTVVSLSIEDEKEHLHIARYRSKECPFVVRLPLTRQTPTDEEDETFSFTDAQAELRDIVEMSDQTIRFARDQPELVKQKTGREKWWDDRKQLDQRLHDLLSNIEHVWLGGFRGAFADHSPNQMYPDQFCTFRNRFKKILDSHLPSRKGARRRDARKTVEVHDFVIELLLTVGETLETDEDETEEALMDLLYFTVDILQHHGEANAYDEIDFDLVLVELQDAIRSYFSSITDNLIDEDSHSHIILILDRKLHSIPWEALPCLRNKSVSRVPSFLDIRDRIIAMRSLDPKSDAIPIKSTSGTFFLNPSGDLLKTQARFEKPLQQMIATKSWSGSTSEEPTERDFLAALQPPTKSHPACLLYFGHGGGQQYIRSNKIRHLRPDGCNAALLFGCSSASLKDEGEFEPHGTPKDYLLAGAPAVLGSLWDVTDGDVDVFAANTLRRWGLLDEEVVKNSGKSRSASQRRTTPKRTESKETSMCLSKAAAISRDECYLKYLNGAAMVVYGVPVVLD